MQGPGAPRQHPDWHRTTTTAGGTPMNVTTHPTTSARLWAGHDALLRGQGALSGIQVDLRWESRTRPAHTWPALSAIVMGGLRVRPLHNVGWSAGPLRQVSSAGPLENSCARNHSSTKFFRPPQRTKGVLNSWPLGLWPRT